MLNYKCQACGTEFNNEVPRKSCPNCKKRKLVEIKDSFITTTRAKDNDKSRYFYDEEGKLHKFRRSELPKVGANQWVDDGKEGHDEADKILKQNFKRVNRDRKPVQMVKKTCTQCGLVESVHPIHASSRERYLCNKCITKMTRR